MKSKKIGILGVILGVLLLVLGVVLMVVDTNDKTLPKVEDNKNNNNNNNNNNNSNECKYNLSGDELVLDFTCDSFDVSGENVTFKFNKGENESYSLNVMYGENSIYSSTEKNVEIYTEDQAGKTSIISIDQLYFVYTYAAGQCGDYGHLIVISQNGEVVKSLNGIFDIDKENKIVYVREMTLEDCGNINGNDTLYDQYTISGTMMDKVGSAYDFEFDTTVSDGNLTFEYSSEEDNHYLNILYNGTNIFDSKQKGIDIYSEDQAGYTKISKIDSVYLIETSLAHQCGNKGTLIVVNGEGKLLGVYDTLDAKVNYYNKSVKYSVYDDGKCLDGENAEFDSVIYYINGNNFSK